MTTLRAENDNKSNENTIASFIVGQVNRKIEENMLFRFNEEVTIKCNKSNKTMRRKRKRQRPKLKWTDTPTMDLGEKEWRIEIVLWMCRISDV